MTGPGSTSVCCDAFIVKALVADAIGDCWELDTCLEGLDYCGGSVILETWNTVRDFFQTDFKSHWEDGRAVSLTIIFFSPVGGLIQSPREDEGSCTAASGGALGRCAEASLS